MQCDSLATAPHRHPPILPVSVALHSRMLICWCGCGPAPPVQGATPSLVLSFCPWIKQLPLSLFSHGSRRSVHSSTALAKAFQSAGGLCGASQGTVAGAAHPSVVDVSALFKAAVCATCACQYLYASIPMQISRHIGESVRDGSNNRFCGEWCMCGSEGTGIPFSPLLNEDCL